MFHAKFQTSFIHQTKQNQSSDVTEKINLQQILMCQKTKTLPKRGHEVDNRTMALNDVGQMRLLETGGPTNISIVVK